MKMLINLCLLFSCLTIGATCKAQYVRSPAGMPQPTGVVEGVLTDEIGAAISGASIIIKNRKIKRQVMVNDEGRYEVELPRGIYWVSVGDSVYRPFRRRLRVVPNKKVILNIKLVVKGPHVTEVCCE